MGFVGLIHFRGHCLHGDWLALGLGSELVQGLVQVQALALECRASWW